jgi:hypothetical protein
MPRKGEPDMHDPQDRELRTQEGVKPYPVPNNSKVVGNPVPDEATSTPDNNFERAGEDEDGEHIDAVDKMRKTLKEDGDTKAWKDGKTQ